MNVRMILSSQWLSLLLLTVYIHCTSADRVNVRDLRCTKTGFFIVPGSCQDYYECRLFRGSIQAIRGRCPPGRHFDDIFSECKPKNLVTSPPRCVEKSTVGREGLDDAVEQEIHAVGQDVKQTSISADGVNVRDFLCTKAGFFIVPGSCQDYYECRLFRGSIQAIRGRCPPGRHFDDIFSECKPKNLVTSPPRCVEKSTVGREGLDDAVEQEIHAVGQDVKQTSTSADRVNVVDLRCTKAGFFIVPGSCQDYYECRLFRGSIHAIRRRCPRGKLFDDIFSECRRKQFVTSPPRCVR